MSKAFDWVKIDFTLRKLYASSVQACHFIMNINLHEKQKYSFQNKDHWVPQGSILDPFLFPIFINELTDHIDEYVTFYIDDTEVIIELSYEHDLQ